MALSLIVTEFSNEFFKPFRGPALFQFLFFGVSTADDDSPSTVMTEQVSFFGTDRAATEIGTEEAEARRILSMSL